MPFVILPLGVGAPQFAATCRGKYAVRVESPALVITLIKTYRLNFSESGVSLSPNFRHT